MDENTVLPLINSAFEPGHAKEKVENFKDRGFHDASDYDTFYIASKTVTAEQIETAEKILELAERYLLTNIADDL